MPTLCTEGDGDRDGVDPVSGHDVDFVDAEAKTDVECHVHAEEGEDEPEELTATTIPDAEEEEKDDDGFDTIVPPMGVANNHWTVAHHVAKEVFLMQLYGFAKEVFYDGIKT